MILAVLGYFLFPIVKVVVLLIGPEYLSLIDVHIPLNTSV